MVRFTLCLQLLLLFLIRKQSNAISDRSGELPGETFSTAGGITELLLKKQERAGQCLEYQTRQCRTLQPTAMTLKQFKAVSNAFYSTIAVANNTVQLLHQTAQQLHEKQQQLKIANVDIKRRLESLNQTVRELCGSPKNVCWELVGTLLEGKLDRTKILLRCYNDSCILGYSDCNTPLTFAACNGRVDWLRVLLEGGANVDTGDLNMMTALHYAASGGHLDMCDLLLKWGANVDAVNDFKNTPLHIAAENGHLKVVQLLVKKVADISLKNEDGLTASDVARVAGFENVTEWLDSKQNHTIQDTCTIPKDPEGVTNNLMIQIQSKEEVLKSNIEEQKKLQTAISRLNKTVGLLNRTVHGLFDQPDVVCRKLFEALEHGDVNIAKNLFNYTQKNCTSEDGLHNTPLIFAANKDLVELVRVFLEGGANVTARDLSKSTALHYAASGGHLDMCGELLNRGANVDPVNNLTNTPLHLAAQNGHLLVVQLLQEKGANIWLESEDGLTARRMARRKGHKEVADWLDSKSCGYGT